ncbi:PTS system, mannose-specific IIA component [Geoalkalibacter ferrihydriticus]|uniref:PTS sugar transporter n=2 Tax=Geoalkalibacter ferrihydriticus TaxID=392333 RepID=A0A0C2HUU0_9BACT|nr:PTS sugar transporter subunit IIA [Geoalkalibacter ferrihydriticus]KIH76577.1 PTS sugar transporter [Geoalkalibacter ferrihydriticus DSM 17813]SDM02177.1 PTS system, mannose-specific IIA component [Geoalkalibacter ferrihydriticus]
MIGLVIATHAGLARELLLATEMIVGPVTQARAVGIQREDSVEEVRGALADAIEAVRAGDQGVLIMTDLFGGTPSNLSISFLDPQRIEVLTGVNLPMVLKFFNSRDDLNVTELAGQLKAYGQQSMALASEFLER